MSRRNLSLPARRCTYSLRENGHQCRRAPRPGAKTCWSHRGPFPMPGRRLLVFVPPALIERLHALVATGLFGETVDEALLQVARDRVVELSGPLLTPRRR